MSRDRRTPGTAATGFVAEADGARWIYAGALTFANASTTFAGAAAMPLPTAGEIDLSGVDAVDSSAVAVLVALKRRASAAGRPLAFTHVPAALTALADVYGVEDMLVS
jgi:phospholipid transport system transporter-binding protein